LENKKANEKLEKLTIRISKNKKEMLKKMVEKSSYNSISELARAGIDKELNIEMYKENLDFIIKALDQMLDEKLKPFIASQRKLNAKYLRTSVINTYLQGEVMNKLLGDNMHKDFIKMLNEARKKANYYISRDTESMSKQDLYDFYTIGELYRNE
jgi:Arc/MetJ-type ribon-helix-helix transcriptional regulator